jgi:hypothetical protein
MSAFVKMAFSAALVICLLSTSDVAAIWSAIGRGDFRYGAAAAGVSLSGMLLAARRWQILLGPFDTGIPFARIFQLICLSYFYNFFIPGGVAGDLIRGLQCRQYRLSGPQGLASVVVDRIIGLGSFLMVGIAGAAVAQGARGVSAPGQWLWAALAGSVLIAGACFNRRLMRVFRILSRVAPSGYDRLKVFYDAVYAYKPHGWIAARALAVSLLTALANIGTFYLLSRAAGNEVACIHFVIFIPLVTIASYVPISYSGLGVRELSFMLLFAQAGMAPDQALAVPLMYFGLILILSLAGGLYYWIAQSLCGGAQPVRTLPGPSRAYRTPGGEGRIQG